MAGGFTNYLIDKLNDHAFGGGDFTRPATVYLALTSTVPTKGAAGTELSGNGYARKAVTNNATNFPASANGAKSNGTDIVFATATGNWAEAKGAEIYDDPTAGNRLGWAELPVYKTVQSGDTAKILAGELDITIT